MQNDRRLIVFVCVFTVLSGAFVFCDGSNDTMQDLHDRCLIDILLPSPTILPQLLCSVICKGMKTKVDFTHQRFLMNSRRIAAQVAGNI